MAFGYPSGWNGNSIKQRKKLSGRLYSDDEQMTRR